LGRQLSLFSASETHPRNRPRIYEMGAG